MHAAQEHLLGCVVLSAVAATAEGTERACSSRMLLAASGAAQASSTTKREGIRTSDRQARSSSRRGSIGSS